MVASVVLITGLVSVAQLFALSTDANRSARRTSMSTVLAQQKVEQLRGLTWGYDAFGLPASDYSTDLAVTPSASSGGNGLGISPADTLEQNTPGFVDYLGPRGEWVGTGTVAPAGTVYVRRWSVTALPTNPNNTLVFQVRVTRLPRTDDHAGDSTAPRDDVRLVSVKTRKAA
jgi:hypothetical protein